MPGMTTYLDIIEEETAAIRDCYEKDTTPSFARIERIEECLRIIRGRPYRPPNNVKVVVTKDKEFDVV